MLDIHEQQLRKACQQVSSLVSAGNRRVVETVLRQYVELSQDPEQVMELVFSEFVAREEGGEQPDRAEYFERFPDLRERLERLFKIHQTLGHENATGAETTAASDTGVSASSKTKLQRAGISKKVGDYEILGEVGRGGMGVVYKARHRTLGRLVALKEIKSNFVEEDQRERLFREASAAARLQHPHVVQIFEVGEGANGPFLSMELISGGSLETRIAENAYDAKDAANILKTLAETMQYAHQNGVIHRDLKPANVLVGDDNHIKLTDFGLAKILEIARQTQEDELSLTQSGAILGTPCYMAPEQVDGKKADVGVATDIYALGAILYELLTGRPPFRGDSPLETFQLIQSSSPVAPRRFRPMLNRDLETICLKCLEKDPWRRYASAAELAEDLSRFLDSQPILARPIGGIERTWRWCKRKPLVTGLGIALGLSLAFGFMAVTSQWMRAEHQKRLAQDNARNTELQRNEAEKQKNQAQYERNRAMREKNRSELNFETAKNVIDRFTRIGETFTRVPQTEQSGRQLLKESLQFYNALLQLESADPLAKFQTALAHYRAARIHQELRQWRESHQTISQAIDLLTELCDDFPSQQDYRLHLTHAYFRYADGSRRAGQNELAEKVFGETMEQCDRFLELFPNDDNLKVIRAIALINGLTVARYGSLEKHANDLKKAIVVLDRVSRVSPLATWIRQNQALGTECLAIAQWQNENRPEAAQSFRNAIAIRTQLAKATGSRQVASQPRILIKPTLLNVDPSMKSTEISSADRVDLHKIENEPVRIDPLIVSAEENLFYQARNHKLLGLVFSELGHGDDAEEHFRFAVTVADDLRAISNSSFHHRILLATSQAELARILMTQSRVDESIDVFSVAAKRYRDLSRGWRKGTAELGESPYLFLQPDRVIASGEKAKTAAKICLEAIEFLDALSDATPSDPHRRNDLARALKLVVPLTRKISSFAHGEKILRNAAALHQQLIEQFPDEPEYRMGLADDYSDLAAHFWRQTELNKAIESYRKAVDIQVEILQQDSKNAQAISSLKTVRRQLAALLNEIGETGDAIQVYRAAIELDPDSAQPHNDLAWQLVTCSDRFHDPAEAVRLAERAVELAPNNATYLNTLGAAHYRAQNFEFAVKNLHQAIANHWGRPTVLDLTVLSLCEYGRGNHQMARQYLSESERWLAWHQNWDPIAEHDRKDIEVFLRSARKALPQVEAVDVLQQKLGKSGVIYLGDQQLFAAATVSGGKIQLQNMAQFGPTWSDDSQLWWHENRTRMRLKLRVEVEREGDYSIFGRFTNANDYGRFQFHVNGQKLGDPIECFNAGPYRFAVINSGRIKLGRAHLPAGRNQFELEIEGKARDSSQYMVGIDDLELVRVR